VDYLQFFSSIFASVVSLLQALAWPIAVFAIASMFIKSTTLLDRIEEFEIKDWFRLSTTKKLDKIEKGVVVAETEKPLLEIAPLAPPPPDPRQIIIEAWKRVEDYITKKWGNQFNLADRHGAFYSMRRSRVVSGRTGILLQQLSDLREEALTDIIKPITMDEANRYERLVQRVIALMEDPEEPYGGGEPVDVNAG
jgi:hypothetical protein